MEALRAEGGRELHGPRGLARRLDARGHRRIGNGLTGRGVGDERDEPALARRRAGSVLMRVVAVALRRDREEGEPDAIAARGLLERLVLRVARVASLALEIRDEVDELRQRHGGRRRHDRAPVAPDIARGVDCHGARVHEGFHEVLRRMMPRHAREVGTRRGRLARLERKLLALDRVAGIALEVYVNLPARRRVAGRQGEAPARRHAARRVKRVHGDARPGCRRGPGCWRRRAVAGMALSARGPAAARGGDEQRGNNKEVRGQQACLHELAAPGAHFARAGVRRTVWTTVFTDGNCSSCHATMKLPSRPAAMSGSHALIAVDSVWIGLSVRPPSVV